LADYTNHAKKSSEFCDAVNKVIIQCRNQWISVFHWMDNLYIRIPFSVSTIILSIRHMINLIGSGMIQPFIDPILILIIIGLVMILAVAFGIAVGIHAVIRSLFRRFKKCSNGHRNDPDAKFCWKCGEPLD